MYPILLLFSALLSSPILYHRYYEVSPNARLNLNFVNLTNITSEPVYRGDPDEQNLTSESCSDIEGSVLMRMRCLSKGRTSCYRSLHALRQSCTTVINKNQSLFTGGVYGCKCGGPRWNVRYIYNSSTGYVFNITGPIGDCRNHTNEDRIFQCESLPCSFRGDKYKNDHVSYYEYISFSSASKYSPNINILLLIVAIIILSL